MGISPLIPLRFPKKTVGVRPTAAVGDSAGVCALVEAGVGRAPLSPAGLFLMLKRDILDQVRKQEDPRRGVFGPPSVC